MASTGLQLLGLCLSLLGWLGGTLGCVVPLWRVTAFIGNNIVTAQTIWEGLWMNCIVQSTGQIQCKVYDSMLALPHDLQAARALSVVSVLLCAIALALGVVGVKCTKCVGQQALKARISLFAGSLFAFAGLLYFIPVCWTAHSIIRDFYNPLVPAPRKRELGPALYLGWGAAGLLVLGGALLGAGSSTPAAPSSPSYSGSSRQSSPRNAPTLPAGQVKGYV
ncbi:CLD4 protein, partial [Atractosteus spatula]|uniref:Claudin n=2 Tax=Lepisosteidae TaxID=7915 RepID=W5NML2_LEPOC|nr:PREDICTED: claudin-4-like [Lepisosteus oculatus]MBN3314286.1 CLD4 protein [Atractosteus spatula]